MTRNEAIAFILSTNGKWFGVEFTKRGNGELRHMTARLGVHKHLSPSGKGPAYNFTDKGLIPCWEAPNSNKLAHPEEDAKAGKELYRAIPIEGLRRISVDGEWFEVTD